MRSRLLEFCFVGMIAMVLSCNTHKAYADCPMTTYPGQFCKGLVRYDCREGCYCTGGTKTSSGLLHAVDVACILRQTGTGLWEDLNAANIFLCPENFPISAAGAVTDCYFTYDNRKVYNRPLTCPLGQYLNVDTCTACPVDAYCPGGTWVPIKGIQGIESVTCNSGYYLPENSTACIVCPENNYCAGGKYGYMPTIAQGVVRCSGAAHFSPTGMWKSTQCGYILHVGTEKLYLHQTKDTEPSLNVEVASGVYYANVSKNKKTMNKNSAKYLKIQLRDDIYYVYDDTNL